MKIYKNRLVANDDHFVLSVSTSIPYIFGGQSFKYFGAEN